MCDQCHSSQLSKEDSLFVQNRICIRKDKAVLKISSWSWCVQRNLQISKEHNCLDLFKIGVLMLNCVTFWVFQGIAELTIR